MNGAGLSHRERVRFLAPRCVPLVEAVARDDRETQYLLMYDIGRGLGLPGQLVALRCVADAYVQWTRIREAAEGIGAARWFPRVAGEAEVGGEEGPLTEGQAAVVDAYQFLIAHVNRDWEDLEGIFGGWAERDGMLVLFGALAGITHRVYDGSPWCPEVPSLAGQR